MMMIEEGKVRLTDPVSRFIPEFKGAKVAMPKPGARAGGPARSRRRSAGGRGAAPEFDVVSANRDITVRDLLTHGSGLMSGGLGNAVAPQRGPNDTLATYIPKLGAVPLDFQPGTLWRYSGQAGFDVLSRIVEIASGQPFDQFLKQRLFDPLGMKDTGFSARPDNQARLVTLYQRGPDGTLTKAANQVGLSSTDVFRRLGRHGDDGRGLRAVRADAAQRRRVERPALSRRAHRAAHVHQPHRRPGERPVRPARARAWASVSACRSSRIPRWPGCGSRRAAGAGRAPTAPTSTSSRPRRW